MMQRTHLKTIYLLFLMAIGCSSKEGEETAQRKEAVSKSPVICVASYPLQYLVERIASSLVEVRFPAKTADDPASWNPTPEAVAEMQKADLIVLNGASYEQWLKNVSLPESRIVVSTRSLQDRFIKLKETLTHSHGPEGKHEHTGVAFTTWLDLTLAIEQGRNVKDALTVRWPEHKLLFEDEFAKLAHDLQALDEEILAITAKSSNRRVIFSHPVYQYFQRRYKIDGRSVHWEPDLPPDEGMWSQLEDLIDEHPAKWMLWESEPLPEIATGLKSLGIESVVIDPCATIPDDGDFITIMRQNIEALRQVYQ